MDSESSSAFQPADIRRLGAEDLISGLPDDLLHTILVRLPSVAVAARTSVLSRRWRGVWAHMPELVLSDSPARAPPPAPSTLLDSIDAALNSYAAPTLNSLKIDVKGFEWCDVDTNRMELWLRFASQRVAGKLCISLYVENTVDQWYQHIYNEEEEELALPICERAREIDLNFRTKFVLRPPQTGSFSSLTDLRIACRRMDGGELGRIVSSLQCPRLRKLDVDVSDLVPVSDVSMCSESLECLNYYASGTAKLEITAPMLREITLSQAAEACIVAPKLEKINWRGAYDPGRHQLAVASRHIQSLSIIHWHWSRLEIPKSSARLMERFDTATEMEVSLFLQDKDIAGYVTFLKEMNKLPVCETLVINLLRSDKHCLLQKMLYVLRRCSCIKKLKLLLSRFTPSKMSSCTMPGCPCLLPERLDDITLDSLEEIGISFFTGSAEQQEFIKVLLSRCNMATLKRLDIMMSSTPVSSEIMVFVERTRTMYSKVQINVLTREVLKPQAS